LTLNDLEIYSGKRNVNVRSKYSKGSPVQGRERSYLGKYIVSTSELSPRN